MPVAVWPLLVVFNVPILVIAVRLPLVNQLKTALLEKDATTGASTGDLSYSRVTGLIGAVIVTSFFWAMGDLVLVKAFTAPGEVKELLTSVGPFFLAGSALFLPYAFNQLKTVFQ